MKKDFRVLPRTIWTAKSLWKIELIPLIVLTIALSVLGIGEGLLLLSGLGSSPWTVFAQGIAIQTHISIGWVSLIISISVMLLWIPLKLKAGFGTLLNILFVALFLGLTAALVPAPTELISQFIYAITGIIILGIATVFYLTIHQGAGPRDGLMVGLCYKFRWKVGIVRTILEVTVCSLGYLLGGTVGIGTLLFAFGIGFVIQITLNIIIKLHQN
ncbi:hypothetical protein EV697_10596 [Bisgaardia hudsonensis]|uniref:Membrane protein YczE n=1 Tax=Bisgaardia hudsonensis TaxID=109472 RepID=A0A4R2MTV7_9PAST|nr:YitT family protein [Bisgaardia hudsonensis]QLB13651.1 hypothetical protein A6A11_08540 [Bisgaardia hudsonensis]TCP11984.1 hypothetical protein EV697_10596 [Bisgaardia hudsonensis]